MSSIVRYTADGTTASFTVPFPFIAESHVKVRIGGVLFTQGAHYDFSGASTVTFRPQFIPVASADVEIRRETPSSSLVSYQNGATLTADDLNTAVLQTTFCVEEVRDYYQYMLEQGFARLNGGAAVSVQEAIDAAVQDVLDSALLANLQARYTDIDSNAEAILTQAGILTNEQAARMSADNNLQSQLNVLLEATAGSVFVQPGMPVAGVGGVPNPIPTNARWYDSDDNNHPYLWNGTTWLDLDDPRIGQNAANIVTLQSTVNNPTTGVNATATALDAVETLVYHASSGNTALASRTTTLESTVNNPTTGVTATANAVSSLTTTVTGQGNTLSAQATALSLLGAVNAGGTAFIFDASTALVDANTSLATRISQLAAQDGTLTSQYNSIINLTVSGTTALAQKITALELADTNNSASISSVSSIVSGSGGLTAQYMVKTDVNGRVAGFGLYNTGATSDFIVLANKFAVVDPANNANVKVPFLVSGGVVYMQNVVIQDALIANLNLGKLTTGTLTAQVTQNADWFVGTGRIIWDNGTYIKAAGIGFGTSNQFLEWFGPRPTGGNLALCSEATAISYLKTNGDAYFGGSLSAGVLRNAATGTAIASNAEVVLGPFGTNGGSKTVACSYTFDHSASVEYTFSYTNPPTATVVLERSLDGGSTWTQIGTQNVTGSVVYEQGYGWAEPGSYWAMMSSSFTVTDNSASTANFMYRLRITARNVSIKLDGSPVTTQRLTVVSTEG